MPSLDEILHAVDTLYAAALDRALWPAALDRLAQISGGMGTAVLSISTLDEQTLASQSLHEAAVDYIDNGWWSRDLLRSESIRRGPMTGLFTHLDVVGEDAVRRHPFFQEFWRKHRVGGMASYCSHIGPRNVNAFSIQRDMKRGMFELEELRVLQTLGPHAARALHIGSRIAATEARARSLEAALDRFTVAALIIDRRARVLALNAAAQGLMGHGYDIAQGALRVSTSVGQKSLDALLKSVFAGREQAGGQALIRREGERPALLAQAFLMPRVLHSPFDLARPGELAFLVLTGSEVPQRASTTGALRALGLTPAEARVAALVGAGASPGEAASVLHLKVSTVRVELKSIFAKLGLRRQSELASLVARLGVVH